jgi:Hemerythrin HHE cation binding domain
LEQLVQEHREATALAEQLSNSEPGPDRDAALADLDRLFSKHLALEEQYLGPQLTQRFKAQAEFVPDAVPPAMAALVSGGPDVDVAAATSTLVQALQDHVEHTEQQLYPAVGQGDPGGEGGAEPAAEGMPPGEVAHDVAPQDVAEVAAEHERGG